MIVDEFVADSHVHSVANLSYFGRSDEVSSGGLEFERGPFIAEAFFTLYSNQDSAVMALQAGEIDFILTPLGIAPALVDHARTDQSVEAVANDTNGFRYLAFNLRRFPMNLPEFRDSLALMVDKEFVADQVLQGAAIPRYTSIPQSNRLWWNEPVASEIASEYVGRTLSDRVTAAVTLLKRAGFTWEQEPVVNQDGTAVLAGSEILYQGNPVAPLEILAPSAGYDPLRATYAVWIESWLDQLGFDAEANPTDLDTLIRQVYVPVEGQLDYDMFLLGWGLGDPSWPTHYEMFWSSRHDTLTNGGHNVTGFSNEGFDELVDRFSATDDQERGLRTGLADGADRGQGEAVPDPLRRGHHRALSRGGRGVPLCRHARRPSEPKWHAGVGEGGEIGGFKDAVSRSAGSDGPRTRRRAQSERDRSFLISVGDRSRGSYEKKKRHAAPRGGVPLR